MAQRKIQFLALTPFLFILILLMCINSSAQNPPAEEPQSGSAGKVETCSIQGTVVAAGNGEALRGARLVLTPISGGMPHAPLSSSSTDGHRPFLLRRLVPAPLHFPTSH